MHILISEFFCFSLFPPFFLLLENQVCSSCNTGNGIILSNMFHKSKQVFLHSPNATKFSVFPVSTGKEVSRILTTFVLLFLLSASSVRCRPLIYNHTLALQHILISNVWLRVPVILSRNLKVWVVFTV